MHTLFKKTNWTLVAYILLFIITLFFRFYNYPNRWGLASDQARDAIVVLRAIRQHTFPLIGPFSASGPFVFGPSWYLVFIFFTAIYPSWVLTPWIIQSIFFVGVVFLMVKIGNLLENKYLGFLMGLFTAISTAQASLSTNLVASGLVSCISTICLFLFILNCKKDKLWLVFLLGFCVSLAITIHFQAIPLGLLLLIIWVIKKRRIFIITAGIMGFFIPLIPLIIFNSQTNFFESTHLMQYFLFNKAPDIPNRWLTYAGVFWPHAWADVIGGYLWMGYAIGLVIVIVTCLSLWKRTITKPMVIVIIAFLGIFISLRYFSGVLFEGFLSFLHPFIICITAWACVRIVHIQRYIGIVFISIIVITSSAATTQLIAHATNKTGAQTKQIQLFLESKYQNKKFAIYDYKDLTTTQSFPLSLFLYAKLETNPSGWRIGISNRGLTDYKYPLIYHTELPYPIYVYDLNQTTLYNVHHDLWLLVNSKAVYDSVEDWYKNNE